MGIWGEWEYGVYGNMGNNEYENMEFMGIWGEWEYGGIYYIGYYYYLPYVIGAIHEKETEI